jgi:hypothetical protein
MWDRYRTLDAKKPNSGLAYSLFNLRALVFTAHIVDVNHDYITSLLSSTTSSPLKDAEEKFESSHDDVNSANFSQESKQLIGAPTCMAYAENAILQALHFYGKYYILYPVNTPARISYAPYRDQQPLYEGLAEFLVGCSHFPDDRVLQRVVGLNILAPHAPPSTANKKRNSKSGAQTQEVDTEERSQQQRMLKEKEPTSTATKPRSNGDSESKEHNKGGGDERHRFTQPEHPLNTPICYLALVLCPFDN